MSAAATSALAVPTSAGSTASATSLTVWMSSFQRDAVIRSPLQAIFSRSFGFSIGPPVQCADVRLIRRVNIATDWAPARHTCVAPAPNLFTTVAAYVLVWSPIVAELICPLVNAVGTFSRRRHRCPPHLDRPDPRYPERHRCPASHRRAIRLRSCVSPDPDCPWLTPGCGSISMRRIYDRL